MTGPSHAFVDLLVPGECGRRAIEETLADWRKERGRADSIVRVCAIDARGLLALNRVLAGMVLKDMATGQLWRMLFLTIVVSAAASLVMIVPYLAGLPASSATPNSLLAALMLVPNGLASVMPLMLSLGLGLRRDRPAPVMGIVVVTMAFLVVMFGWGVPMANQAFRELVSSSFWDWTVPPPVPGLAELTLPGLVDVVRHGNLIDGLNALRVLNVRTSLVVAAPVVFFLGLAIRNLLRNRYWRLAQALGPLVTIGLTMLGTAVAAAAFNAIDWPLAERARPFNPDIWATIVLASLVTVALALFTKPGTGKLGNPEP
jgi:hypothetical protein